MATETPGLDTAHKAPRVVSPEELPKGNYRHLGKVERSAGDVARDVGASALTATVLLPEAVYDFADFATTLAGKSYAGLAGLGQLAATGSLDEAANTVRESEPLSLDESIESMTGVSPGKRFNQTRDLIQQQKSDVTQLKTGLIDQEQGFFDRAKAFAGNMDVTGQMVLENVGLLFPTAAAARIAALPGYGKHLKNAQSIGLKGANATKYARNRAIQEVGKEVAVKRGAKAAMATEMAMGAAFAGDEAAQTIYTMPQQEIERSASYTQLRDRFRQQGLDDEQADEQARKRLARDARYAAGSLAAASTSAVSKLSGVLPRESAIFSGLGETTRGALGTVLRFGGTTGREAVQEAGQEAGEQVAANIGVGSTTNLGAFRGGEYQPIGPNMDWLSAATQGAGEAAAAGAVIGAGIGAPVAGAEAFQRRGETKRDTSQRRTEEPSATARESTTQTQANPGSLQNPIPQSEVGDQAKGRVSVQDLDISIENPKGSERKGTGPDGRPRSQTMRFHHGHVRSGDGNRVDIYLGEGAETAELAYLVSREEADATEQPAVVLGTDSPDEALQAVLGNGLSSEAAGRARIKAISVPRLKEWLKGRASVPVGDNVEGPRDAVPAGGPVNRPEGVATVAHGRERGTAPVSSNAGSDAGSKDRADNRPRSEAPNQAPPKPLSRITVETKAIERSSGDEFAYRERADRALARVDKQLEAVETGSDAYLADRTELLANMHREAGADREAARTLAIHDIKNELLDEREDIVSQIRQAGGAVPGEKLAAPREQRFVAESSESELENDAERPDSRAVVLPEESEAASVVEGRAEQEYVQEDGDSGEIRKDGDLAEARGASGGRPNQVQLETRDTGDGRSGRVLQQVRRTSPGGRGESGVQPDAAVGVSRDAERGDSQREPHPRLGELRQRITATLGGDAKGRIAQSSAADAPAPYRTAADLKATLTRRFGKGIDNLLSGGVLKIVETAEDLPPHLPRAKAGRTEGVYDPSTGTGYMIAANIAPGRAAPVLLHEIGEHYGLETMLGKKGYQTLLRRVRGLKKIGNKPVSQAWAHVLKTQPRLVEYSEPFLREVVARVGESGGQKPSFWRQLVEAVKEFLLKLGIGSVSDRDIQGLVTKSLRQAMDSRAPRTLSSEESAAGVEPKRAFMFSVKAETDYHQENERLRENDRKVWDRAKQYLKRQFAPGGLLPKSIFEAKISRDSQFNAIEFDVRHHLGRFENAVKSDYSKAFAKLSDEQKEQLNQALAGQVPEGLAEKTREAVYAMRQYIDRLSTSYIQILNQEALSDLMFKVGLSENEAKGVIDAYVNALDEADHDTARLAAEQQLKSTIESEGAARSLQKVADTGALEKAARARIIQGNVGEYVHRSYQAFDDPKWFKKLDDETINAARQYLIDQYGQTLDEVAAKRRAEVTLHEMVKTGTAYDSMSSFLRESKLGAKDLSILTRRKRIAPEIRALLGEYKDPRINYAKSATKMGRLIWNQMFLNRIMSEGYGSIFFAEHDKPPEATSKIAAEGSEVYAPLNGLWTYPEVAQGLEDSLNKEHMALWYEKVVQLNGMVKFGKTVLSPTTAFRNWMSAAFFAMANGHFDMRHMGKSAYGFREYFTQQGSGEKLAYLRELLELGVIYDNPYAGEMMRLLEDSQIESMLMRGEDPLLFGKGLQISQKFYQYGDDFWKIPGYENEKALLMKHGGFDEATAKKMAAERIRNTYPTYSMVGRMMNWLRRFPLVGTFVSFPSEIIRTTANMLRYTAADLENPKLRPLGVRRAMGLSFAASFGYATVAFTKLLFGIDDDEEEAIRDLSPTWRENSDFMFLGRDDEGNIRFVDVSFVDPYNYWKRPITAMLRDEPWADKAVDSIREVLEPFLGRDIGSGAILEVVSNEKESGGRVYLEGDSPLEQTKAIANHLRRSLQPGLMSNIERTYMALDGQTRRSGEPYDPMTEVVSWFGWRASKLDPKVALYYRSFEFKDHIRNASAAFTRTATDPNEVDVDDIEDAMQRSLNMRAKAFREMHRIIQAARKSGMEDEEIARMLRVSKISKRDTTALIRGYVPAWQPSDQSLRSAMTRAVELLGREKAREIAKRYGEARKIAAESE